jgi:hypothetical protein
MSDLITYSAILGQTQLMPGVLPVKTINPSGECLVAHSFPNVIKDEKHNIEIDVSDCTVYTVTHIGKGNMNLMLPANANELLEQALQAISEITVWSKSMDQVGDTSAFTRQVGRLDLKFFCVEAPSDKLIAWRNPLYWANREGAGMMAGLLGNMKVQNGPAANPIPYVVRRIMGSLDLVNLGFYTESFVNLFALVDDLTQEVVKAGLSKKGISPQQQNSLLRAIKEERLKLYLTNLAKLCDWKSLEEENPEHFKKLMKANQLRNDILHGPMRMLRQEALESGNTLITTINWLRTNPFGYVIPEFPIFKIAEVEFHLLDPTKKEKSDNFNNGKAKEQTEN